MPPLLSGYGRASEMSYGQTLFDQISAAWLLILVSLSPLILLYPMAVQGLGSMAAIATSYSRNTGNLSVCAFSQAGGGSILCWHSSASPESSVAQDVLPSTVPFLGMVGGDDVLCALRQDNLQPLCWSNGNTSDPKRLSPSAFSYLAVGDRQACAIQNDTAAGVVCWRTNEPLQEDPPPATSFSAISSGGNFTCGLVSSTQQLSCWGAYNNDGQPVNGTFQTIQSGFQHTCGITAANSLVACWGNNAQGQLELSDPMRTQQFVALALGDRHSCGIASTNGLIVSCWGDNSSSQLLAPAVPMVAIAAGDIYTCGIHAINYSVHCWGGYFGTGQVLPQLGAVLPGPCISTMCPTNYYTDSSLCSSSGQHVCLPCSAGCPQGFYESSPCRSVDRICTQLPVTNTSVQILPPAPPTISPTPPGYGSSTGQSNALGIAGIVVGSVGTCIGFLSITCCLLWKLRKGDSWRCIISFNLVRGRVHHHHHTTSASAAGGTFHGSGVLAGGSLKLRRSGPTAASRTKSVTDITADKAQAFGFVELAAATDNFAETKVVGAGSFGKVYRGHLWDGREVAIKRGDPGATATAKEVLETETAFLSELEFLSRVHHKHLVSLIGYCDEEEERMLVYEYMPNGTLYDHLHKHEEGMEWATRMRIAIEAARGIEYLHTYAVPPIIHRDIKSSNILLDATWTARVADFGLSLMGPVEERSHLSLKVAGTVGYMDPEYYRLQQLTTKSDVYSFGVVLLEILTGQKAVHKADSGPINVVDFAIPHVLAGSIENILDPRAPPLLPGEGMEAVFRMATLAERCVRLEGKDRPNMTEIVSILEDAMLLFNPSSPSHTIVLSQEIQEEEEEEEEEGR